MRMEFEGLKPRIGRDVFVAGNATLIGDVRLADGASVWFSAVLRADIARIEIGAGSNVQDGTLIHVSHGVPTLVGAGVTIGHGVILHGAEVGDLCLIGMGAILLDGARIGDHSLVAAGALVTPGTVIPPRSLVMGSPAKVKRELTPGELEQFAASRDHYLDYARRTLAAAGGAS